MECSAYFFSPNNYNIWNFLVKIAFFIKTINYKTSVKTHIKNILQRTMIVTLLLWLSFNRNIVVAVWCHVFICQCNKARMLCCKYKNSIILNQIVNSGKKRLNIGNIHDRHI